MKKMIKGKKAMELPTNFLVGLILGITLLSFGLMFSFRVFSSADELKADLPDYFEIEARSCVQRGEKGCIPEIKKSLQTGKQETFGVVVNNVYGSEAEFKLFVDFSRGVLEGGGSAPSQNSKDWTFEEFTPVKLENNEHQIIGIPMKVPKSTEKGTYVFNVNICFDKNDNPSSKCSGSYGSLYTPTQQISVTVE